MRSSSFRSVMRSGTMACGWMCLQPATTGRPIPEVLRQYAQTGELIAHDCGLTGNPSHSGIDDLEREYCLPLAAPIPPDLERA